MKILTSPAKEQKTPYTYVRFDTKEVTMFLENAQGRSMVVHKDAKSPQTQRTFRTLVRFMVRTAKSYKIEKLALAIDDIITDDVLKNYTRAHALQTLAENLLIADYEFTTYRTSKTREKYVAEMLLSGDLAKEDLEAIARGVEIGTAVNSARNLANIPGGDMTPRTLALSAQTLAKGTAVKVTVLGKKEIEREKMGALLGVSRGSVEDPRFIIMEYWGAGKGPAKKASGKQDVGTDEYRPVVFIGKGITFDTGGLNLKPSDAVLDMHLDMSGGAAVIAAVICAARLKLKKNIIGLIPAAENMVSGESYRPGDILTTMSGKTVEVLNTDAEGRLVLADALTYARKYNPKVVIDVATLTGAALVALGQHASAIMTQDEALQATLMKLGEESGDYVWPLPLWQEYKQHTKGTFADIANIPVSGARYGGAINGGMFLTHFAEGLTWAHIDMAPRMTAAPGDHLSKGATGEPVRLLVALAIHY